MTMPPSPARVLVAVDFGEASASAVALAGALAQAFGAQLTVLHAETVEMPPYFTSAQIDALETERKDARAAAAEYVRTFASHETPMPISALIVDGPPAEAILRQAPEFDLVVLGTHGRRGPRRWWLGSVAEAVVQGATTPVLVTRVVDDVTVRAFRERHVAVAVTGGGRDASARWVRLLEQTLHATIVRAPELAACESGRLQSADLVLVGLDGRDVTGRLPDASVQVLQGCARPVLFVSDERVRPRERRSS
jgi:nucleotide-binding universal stress UspA family protein